MITRVSVLREISVGLGGFAVNCEKARCMHAGLVSHCGLRNKKKYLDLLWLGKISKVSSGKLRTISLGVQWRRLKVLALICSANVAELNLLFVNISSEQMSTSEGE